MSATDSQAFLKQCLRQGLRRGWNAIQDQGVDIRTHCQGKRSDRKIIATPATVLEIRLGKAAGGVQTFCRADTRAIVDRRYRPLLEQILDCRAR